MELFTFEISMFEKQISKNFIRISKYQETEDALKKERE